MADYIIGFIFLTACFGFFFHNDIQTTGMHALNYLFGNYLEFYENCKKFLGLSNYPPSIYIIFATWLYPFKLLGLITGPEVFSIYLVYWLKLATTIAYIVSGLIFYHVAKLYFLDKEWAKYAAFAWLTMPLALFSQFIFSQYDIFYILLTIAGFLMFLRGKLCRASLFFGLAITFKYFPAFVFLPLLLFYEKRFFKIIFYCAIFAIPTLFIYLLYGHSPDFIKGVMGFSVAGRIFSAFFDVGGWHVYYLFISFTVLCGLAYFSEIVNESRSYVAAYIWLVASVLPFIFVVWHPQWLIFVTPAIVLTSMLSSKRDKFMFFDLIGMFLFIAATSLYFQDNVDTAMFRGGLFGMKEFKNSYFMAKLFNILKGHSGGAFLSAFSGYLVLQIIIKRDLILQKTMNLSLKQINYDNIRRNFYIGSLIFILPACFCIYKSYHHVGFLINHEVSGNSYGELLKNRSFEQTFIAKGKKIKVVGLFLATYIRSNSGHVLMELIDRDGKILSRVEKSALDLKDNAWADFVVKPPVAVSKNAQYKIRLTSLDGAPGNSITWWASPKKSYAEGESRVDGVLQEADFGFRVAFTSR